MDVKGNLTALDVNELEKLLLLLLQQKLKNVACLPESGGGTIKREGSGHLRDVLNQLSPGGVGLIHFSAALGYDWAVSILLQGGAKIQLKVSPWQGWSMPAFPAVDHHKTGMSQVSLHQN